MHHLIRTLSLLALTVCACLAQQSQALPPPGQPPTQYGSRVNSVVRSDKPQTFNYQLELVMQKGGKTARYLLTFNGGQISTELVDKLAEPKDAIEPRMINFTASFAPFEESKGGEISLHIGRSIPFKTKIMVQGAEKEGIQYKPVSLSTKVALMPGKAVVLFDDEEEKISLKLTNL